MSTAPQFIVPYVFAAQAGAASITQQGETISYTGPVDFTYNLIARADLLSQVFSFAEGADPTKVDVTASRAALGAFLLDAFDRAQITGTAVGQMAGDLQKVLKDMIDVWLTRTQEYARDTSKVLVTPAAMAQSVQDVLAPSSGPVTDPMVVAVLQAMYEQAIAADPDRVAKGTDADAGDAVDTSRILYRLGDKLDLIFNVTFQNTPIAVSASTIAGLDPAEWSVKAAAAPTIQDLPAHAPVRVKFAITLYQDALRSADVTHFTKLYNVLTPGESLFNDTTKRALVYGADGSVKVVDTLTSAVVWTGSGAPASGTASYLVMQRDGLLAAYSSASSVTPYWTASATAQADGVYLATLAAPPGNLAVTRQSDSAVIFSA